MLPMAVFQSAQLLLLHRYREQAPSHTDRVFSVGFGVLG